MTSSTPTTTSGLQLHYMNRDVRPGDDFGEYANGKWEANNPIPDEYASWGVFMMLRDRVLYDLRKICDSANASTTPHENGQKLAMFWQSAMNEDLIEQQGLGPLKELLLDQLETRVNTVQELVDFIGRLHTKGCACVFEASVIPDFKDSTTERLIIGQGGLGLPDKEYYLDEDKAEIRTKYVEHVCQMFQLAGVRAEAARKSAEKVLELETRLANESKSKTDMRDIAKLYNPLTFDALKTQKFDWTTYFHAIGFDTSKATLIINSTPSFFDFLGDQLTSASIGDWKLVRGYVNIVNI